MEELSVYIIRIPTICIHKRPASENEEDQNNTHRSNSQNRSDNNNQTSSESNRPLLQELNDSNPSGSNGQNSTELISLDEGASCNLSSRGSNSPQYTETREFQRTSRINSINFNSLKVHSKFIRHPITNWL